MNYVTVFVFLKSGNMLEYNFETINKMCDYEVYELMGRVASDYMEVITDEHGYPELRCKSATGFCIQRMIKKS